MAKTNGALRAKTTGIFRTIRVPQEKGRKGGWMSYAFRDNKVHKKFFADQEYYNSLVAYDCANSWAKGVARKGKGGAPTAMAPPRKVFNPSATKAATNTGVPGIRYLKKQNGYEAYWTEKNGSIDRQFFSISEWGKKGAFDMAKDARNTNVARRQMEEWGVVLIDS